MSTVEQHRPGQLAPSRSDIDEARGIARSLGLEYVDLDRYPLNAAAASLIPEQVARRHHALAVGWKYGTPVVAVTAPGNVLAMDDLRSAVGQDIHAIVACASQIDAYIERMYNATPAVLPVNHDSPAAGGTEGSAAGGTEGSAVSDAPSSGYRELSHDAPPDNTAELRDGATTDLAGELLDSPPPFIPGDLLDDSPSLVPGEVTDDPVTGTAHDLPAGDAIARPPVPAFTPASDEVLPEAVHLSLPEDLFDDSPVAAAQLGAPAGADGTPEAAVEIAALEALKEVVEATAGSPELLLGDRAEPEPPAAPMTLAIDGLAPVSNGHTAWPPLGGAATAEKHIEAGTPPPAAKPALRDILLASGQVTGEEMGAALRESAATGRSLGVILNELGLVSEEDLIRWMAEEAGLEFIDLNEYAIDSRAISLLPETMARRHQVLAIGFRNEHPIVAMSNPSNVFALDDLRTVLGRSVETVVSSPRQITDYISRMYRHDKEAADAARSAVANQSAAEVSATALELTDLHAVVEDAPIVKYVNLILRQALQERASDVHVEPAVDDLRVRFRIDGVLHDITRSPKSIQGGVTTRLKVMANLDIAEHRTPQDGRISLTAGSREIDLRVATLPTVHGEKVVLRILDKTNAMMNLSDLGFLPEVDRRYQLAYRKPYGTILVTGPTGSGKSTTLYATLNALNSPERNLITVEDPVEYQLPGVNQVQVNPKAGLTFASALRSILRADPDIILVGEMRDQETAIMGVEAALTGHLVLSSLHTNDAAGTPMRLVEMGVEPFLVASALDCVVAQRLARQLCDNCNETHDPTAEELELLGWEDADAPHQSTPRFRKAVGCQACSRTGYRGRIALHELLIISEEVERAIIANASADDIQRIGVSQGTVPLRHDGLRKAALGLTSLEEVIRVVA